MIGNGSDYTDGAGVRVFVARAYSYEEADIRPVLEALAEAAGGWDVVAPPGRPALVKPNLMAAREPARAVTTHPAFIGVLATILRERGREVIVGDSPAGAVRGIKRVWENTGAAAAARAAGVPLVSFEASGSVTRRVNSRFIDEIRVARVCDEAAVIGVAKLKTHFLTTLTGAVKNCLGIIPGLAKAELHRRAPHPEDFSELLVDLIPALAPTFTFVDGVVGLEGDGPASGDAREFNVVVAGDNVAAVDVVLARMLGFAPEDVLTVKLSIERGLAPADPEVVWVGEGYAELVFGDVAAPGSLWLRHLPRPLLRFAGRQFVIRPAVVADRCDGCEQCVASCPVGAARLSGDVASIDPAKCIQCLCCCETCAAEAIRLKPLRVARLYYGIRDLNRRRRRRRS
ncbi:MAG: DUF362 domain-containing protein [candidate division Zixibacteria bacterium]|nr:DUF362 domain-containing protein [candidate division Zixibacteria bacterium]